MREILKELNHPPIAVFPVYVDLAGDHATGTALSQIMFIHSTVQGDSFPLTNQELSDKCRFTEKQLKRVIRKLKTLSFITLSRQGVPAKNFYTIDCDKLIQEIKKVLTSRSQKGPTVRAQMGPTVGVQKGPTIHIGDKEEIKKENKLSSKQFVPPSLKQVEAYAEEKGVNNPKSAAKIFYDFFTADPDQQWIDSKGNPVKSWKQKFLTWKNHGNFDKLGEKSSQEITEPEIILMPLEEQAS